MSERVTDIRGIPVPETQYAILPSDGVPRATEHDWVATEEVAPLAEGVRSFVFKFRCRETGAVRVWGYEDRDAETGLPVHLGKGAKR